MPGKSGFSILGLLGTLLFIAVGAGFAVPVYFARGEVTLENAGILLARDLRAVQNRAAYLSEVSRVVFLEHGDGYLVTNEQGDVIRNPCTNRPFERRYSADGVFRGVRILDVRLGGDRTLVYDDRGMPLESGEMTLSFRGEERALRLQKHSGKIEIVGSTSGWIDPGY